jgi:hypothetical protein
MCSKYRGRTFDVLLTPGSGFFVNSLMGFLEDRIGRIVFYDASTEALEYKKRINENWQPHQPLPPVSASSAEINDRMILFNEKIFPNATAVETHWQHFRSTPKTYAHINLIENPDALATMVPETGTAFVWLSNIYTYSLNVQLFSLDEITYSFLRLIREVRRRNPETIVAGRNPAGRYFYDRVGEVYLGQSNFHFF